MVKALAAFAHPTDLSGRHTCHQSVGFDVLGHHSTRGNEGAFTHRMSANHRAVGSQRGTLADAGLGIHTMHGKMGARCGHISEHATRSTKHIILNINAFVNRNIILHADIVANMDIITHIHILSERAIFADDSTFLDMAKMPDLGPFANAHIVVDVAAFVYVLVVLLFFLFLSESVLRTFDMLRAQQPIKLFPP